MLAWVVIDRTYSRQFLPKSSSLRTLCLCVEFSDSLRPAPVVPTTYALPLATVAPQPLCNQSVTHSFYLDGGCITPCIPPRGAALTTAILSNAYPMFPISSIFNPVRTLLHSPKTQLFYFQAIPHSASKNTTTGGVGEGVRQLSASSCSFLGNSARPKWATFSRRHSTPVTSHSHQSLPLEAVPFARGYRSARIRMETHDT